MQTNSDPFLLARYLLAYRRKEEAIQAKRELADSTPKQPPAGLPGPRTFNISCAVVQHAAASSDLHQGASPFLSVDMSASSPCQPFSPAHVPTYALRHARGRLTPLKI